MKRHRPIFVRISGVIFLLIIPIAILYAYFSRTSLEVIDSQITVNNESKLIFLKNQIESNIERLSLTSGVLARDSSILSLQLNILIKDYYEMIYYQTQVKEKLQLQSLSSNWRNNLSVFLPESRRRISTDPSDTYDESILQKGLNGTWQLQAGDGGEGPYYQMLVWDPYQSYESQQNVIAVFEVRFGLDNIRKILLDYKQDNPGQAFLLTRSGAAFTGSPANDQDAAKAGRELLAAGIGDAGHHSMEIDSQKAFVSYAYLPALDVYLVDYVPLNIIHAPIIESRNLFYLTFVVLLLLGLIASYLLYLNVQKPISAVVKGLKKFEMGDYSFRIRKRFNNEFDYMMLRFNEMGEVIQHLIRDVYEEQNRSRLATLKQLQSQINPHFLYNCLSFIAACAKAGETETIKEMTYHLGDYYRYTTRVENQRPRLHEEVALIENYLNIYALRLERLNYRIEIPLGMQEEPVLRLILQPVVENAIIHGIEPVPGTGTIWVSAYQEESFNVLAVEDSGTGMATEAMEQYIKGLDEPMDEHTGCGLWNVNQRLVQQFGPGAGIFLEQSLQLSGLRVMLRWRRETGGNETDEASALARR
ncbi:MAG: histidine kinase [Gorillibacterium sp.]|nr:histidine kinase [Gorillibacterium sp.]